MTNSLTIEDLNDFIFKALSCYTSMRKLNTIGSDLEDFICTKEEEILRKARYSYTGLPGSPLFLGTGSASEGLGIFGNDFDLMAVLPNREVKFQTDSSRTCSAFMADLTHSPVGFCRLVPITRTSDGCVENGFLVRDRLMNEIKQHNPHLKDTNVQGPAFECQDCNEDYVPALKCLDWPDLCNEYFRRSGHLWPSQGLIDEIKQDGMHIVCKASSDESPDPFEFRTSFSLAEKTLIRAFNDVQFTTYYFLKVVKDDLALTEDHPLKSYFVKTALIRMIEDSPPDVWSKENFLLNTKRCLKSLQSSFELGHLPHLFIKDCNLLAKINQEKSALAAKDLCKLLTNWECAITDMFFWRRKKVEIHGRTVPTKKL